MGDIAERLEALDTHRDVDKYRQKAQQKRAERQKRQMRQSIS